MLNVASAGMRKMKEYENNCGILGTMSNLLGVVYQSGSGEDGRASLSWLLGL